MLLSPLLNEYPHFSDCGAYLPVGSSSPSLPLNNSMYPHSWGTSSYLHSLLAPSQPTSGLNEVLQRRGRTWVESLKGSIRWIPIEYPELKAAEERGWAPQHKARRREIKSSLCQFCEDIKSTLRFWGSTKCWFLGKDKSSKGRGILIWSLSLLPQET